MFAIEVNTPIEGFKAIFNHVMNNHINLGTEDDDFTYEGGTCLVHIRQPMRDHDELIKASCQGPRSFQFYIEQLVHGFHRAGFSYTYYGRLREYAFESTEEIDQISCLLMKLRDSPATRRAVATTWQPWTDLKIDDPPCMDLLKLNIRGGKLNLRVLFRSHDILKAWPQNITALAHLQKYIAEMLLVSIGYLEVTSYDPHIYYKADQNLVKSTMVYFDIQDKK